MANKLHDARRGDAGEPRPSPGTNRQDWEDHSQDKCMSVTWSAGPLLSTLEPCLKCLWSQPVIISKKLSLPPCRPSQQWLFTEPSASRHRNKIPATSTLRGTRKTLGHGPNSKGVSFYKVTVSRPVTVNSLWRRGLLYWAKCKLWPRGLPARDPATLGEPSLSF